VVGVAAETERYVPDAYWRCWSRKTSAATAIHAGLVMVARRVGTRSPSSLLDVARPTPVGVDGGVGTVVLWSDGRALVHETVAVGREEPSTPTRPRVPIRAVTTSVLSSERRHTETDMETLFSPTVADSTYE
jgi:hypothetical protein